VKVAAVALIAVALVALAGVALALAAPWRHGGSQGGDVSVTESTLRPGSIALVVKNGTDAGARVAQVILNDAFVDFRASRLALPPGAAETITVSYPWIHGEAYEIELMTSTGRTVGYEIEEAA
jgi:archaellum component FlaF (FlaF/FlaG flagellin family)